MWHGNHGINPGSDFMKILFAAGGTAGHINPALAIANHIREKEKDTQVLFVGTKNGMETTLVPKSGYDIEFVNVRGFKRKLSLKNVKNVFDLGGAILKSIKIIKKFRPDVVVGTGGYVTGPVLLAAYLLKIPTMVHESNAFPGVTVRMLSDKVDIVALGMKDAEKFLKNPKRVEVVGNPIRPEIFKETYESAREKLGVNDKPVILVFGGSLGATYFNQCIVHWISEVAKEKKYTILMSTGRNNQYDTVMEHFHEHGIETEDYKEISVSEYIYDMDKALNACDLIIARSGSSVSEMTALGKPAILIPSPNVAGNHQEHNARAVEKSGGAVVITEDVLTGELLTKTVDEILSDKEKLETMKKGALSLGITDATEKMRKLIMEIIK